MGKNNIHYTKYFIIRLLEINTHNNNNINENNNLIFEEIFQKRKVTRINNKNCLDNHLNNNYKDEKKIINWKRVFINNVIKAPKILEYKEQDNIQVILDSNNELHLNR